MRTSIVVVAAIAMGFCTTGAKADLTFCNETGHELQVAVAYHTNNNGADDWVSEGWWTIKGGQCAVTLSGNLKNRYYYDYAESSATEWKGDYSFCVSPTSFTIHGADGNCESRGYKTYKFHEVDTGNANDWRQSLSD